VIGNKNKKLDASASELRKSTQEHSIPLDLSHNNDSSAEFDLVGSSDEEFTFHTIINDDHSFRENENESTSLHSPPLQALPPLKMDDVKSNNKRSTRNMNHGKNISENPSSRQDERTSRKSNSNLNVEQYGDADPPSSEIAADVDERRESPIETREEGDLTARSEQEIDPHFDDSSGEYTFQTISNDDFSFDDNMLIEHESPLPSAPPQELDDDEYTFKTVSTVGLVEVEGDNLTLLQTEKNNSRKKKSGTLKKKKSKEKLKKKSKRGSKMLDAAKKEIGTAQSFKDKRSSSSRKLKKESSSRRKSNEKLKKHSSRRSTVLNAEIKETGTSQSSKEKRTSSSRKLKKESSSRKLKKEPSRRSEKLMASQENGDSTRTTKKSNRGNKVQKRSSRSGSKKTLLASKEGTSSKRRSSITKPPSPRNNKLCKSASSRTSVQKQKDGPASPRPLSEGKQNIFSGLPTLPRSPRPVSEEKQNSFSGPPTPSKKKPPSGNELHTTSSSQTNKQTKEYEPPSPHPPPQEEKRNSFSRRPTLKRKNNSYRKLLNENSSSNTKKNFEDRPSRFSIRKRLSNFAKFRTK